MLQSWMLFVVVISNTNAVIFIHDSFPEVCKTVKITSQDVVIAGQYRRVSRAEWCDGQPVYAMEGVYLYHSEGSWRLGSSPCLAWNARLQGGLSKWLNQDGEMVAVSVKCDSETPINVEWERNWVTVDDGDSQRGSWVLDGRDTNMGLSPKGSLRDNSIAGEVSLEGHSTSNPLIVQFTAELSPAPSVTAQLKLFPKQTNLKQLTSRSEFLLLFGPNVRTLGTRTEASLDVYLSLPGGKFLVRTEKVASLIRMDGRPHVYHLSINPDRTFTAGVDGVHVMKGKVEPTELTSDHSHELAKHGHRLRNGQGHFAFAGHVGAVGFASYHRHAKILVDDILITDDVQTAHEHNDMRDDDGEEKVLAKAPLKQSAEELLLRMKNTMDEHRESLANEKWEQKRRLELQAKQLEMDSTLMRLTEQALVQLKQAKTAAADFAIHEWDHAIIALATICQTAVILVLLFKLSVNGDRTVLLREQVSVKNGHKANHEDRNNNKPEHSQQTQKEKLATRRHSAFVRRSLSCDMSSGIQ